MKAISKHSGRIERHRPRNPNDPLNQAAFAWRRAYEAACKHDGIPVGAKFAAFSAGNPFAPFVDRAAAEYFACKREYEAGGYVGLQLYQL
jgi:hypothetical protein